MFVKRDGAVTGIVKGGAKMAEAFNSVMLLGVLMLYSPILHSFLIVLCFFATLKPSLDAHLESLLVLGVEWAGMSPDFSGPELSTARTGRTTQ